MNNPNQPSPSENLQSNLIRGGCSQVSEGHPGLDLFKEGTDNHNVLRFMMDGSWHNAPQYMETLDKQNFVNRNFAFRSRISDIKRKLPQGWQIESRKMKGSSIYEYRLTREQLEMSVEVAPIFDGDQRIIALK